MRTFRSFLFIFLIAFLLPLPLFAQAPTEVWVCATGDCGHGSSGFNSIQQGINAAAIGGTVHIADGVYNEALVIHSAVSLLGASANRVTIESGSASDCITILASNVVIDGVKIKGGRHGVFAQTMQSSLRHSVVEEFALDGIHLVNSDFNLIEGNAITGAGATSVGNGISLEGSRNNSIIGNTIRANAFNIAIAADAGRTSRENVLHGNTLFDPSNWSVALYADAAGTKVNFNVFKTTPTNDRYIGNVVGGMVNAQFNWFGGENPPQPTDFSGGVNYANHYATNLTIFMFPTIHYMKPTEEVDVYVLGLVPAGTQVRGTTMTLGWNNSVVSLQSSPLQGSFYTLKLVAPQIEFFAYSPLAPTNSVTIDQSLMGGSTGAGNTSGVPYVAMFYSLRFQGAATGATTISFSDVLVRDPNNNTINPTIVAPTQIIIDGQPPTISNIVIDNTTLNTDESGDTFDDYVKNTDNVVVTANITDNTILMPATITADLSGFYGGVGHTADPPNSFVAPVATWIVNNINCSPANGSITVTISAKDTLDNLGTNNKSIIADNIAPTKILGFNCTPGHKKVTMQWSDPSSNDAHFKGVTGRYNRWNGYPQYNIAAPTYPTTPASGTEAIALAMGLSALQIFTLPDRDVYYYTAFGVDWAGNFSTADAASQDRSTNYYRGDLGSGTGLQIPGSLGYDGRVNFDDLSWFSALYGVVGTFPYPTAREADFAPTAATKNFNAGHRFGIPVPDNRVNFEDLIIFSFNYASVAPKISPPPNARIANALALSLSKSANADDVLVKVQLENNGTRVKGCSAQLRFDQSELHYVGATNGNVFGSAGQGLYFIKADDGTIQVDAAVLGTDRTVNFSGDVASLRFRRVGSGEGSVTLGDVSIRDEKNNSFATSKTEPKRLTPSSFQLQQNYPNPFNPETKIAYELPKSAHVSLDVMNILGEVVARLVDENKDAGYHQTSWDARNCAGESVASGLYFCRIKAGDFVAVKRMILLR